MFLFYLEITFICYMGRDLWSPRLVRCSKLSNAERDIGHQADTEELLTA